MAGIAQVLTVAGSDSGGGAGIQADLKAMQANGVFGMSVITSITAQNTKAVTTAYDLPVEIIEAQMDAVFDDFDVASVKTGMLSSSAIVRAVAARLTRYRVGRLVVDPVMISKSGYDLLRPEAVETVKRDLIPLALVVTPNVHEAERLAGLKVKTLDDAKRAAEAIIRSGCRSVLIKGGHLFDQRATDLLFDGEKVTLIEGEFIETPHTHGTGCAYSAAIAAHLGVGKPLVEAVRAAKTYITEAIRHGLAIGHGHGPPDHFYFLR